MPQLLTLLPFTPFAKRHESPHGQGLITYDQSNALHAEQVGGQSAPDPIRYGDTPARPARRQIAIMSTRPDDWGYGLAGDFIPNAQAHILTQRLMPAGRQLDVRAQNSVGERVNIERPPAVTYGSLFALSSQKYDVA